MTDYQLRPADPGDAEVLLRIHWASMSDYLAKAFGGYTPEDARTQHERWLDEGRAQVIMSGGEVAGSVDIAWLQAAGYLIRIEIDPAFQGRGLGTAIVTDMLSQCARRGIPARLSVFAHNPALKLYRRLGFRETDRDGPSISMQWDPPSPRGPGRELPGQGRELPGLT